MACLHEYKCDGCGLEGEISGGPDALFAGPTKSYYCENCENLSDLLDVDYLEIVHTPKKCPYCNSQKLTEWVDGQPCPRCGGNLKINPDGFVTMAD